MKQKLILLLALSLLVPLHVSGNPGGVGNSLENMQCGGACHGDANQNATSNLQLSLQPSGTVWAGQPTEITVQISGFDTSHDIDQIGIFLLSSTNANNDIPTTDGWRILSDGPAIASGPAKDDENCSEARAYFAISQGKGKTPRCVDRWGILWLGRPQLLQVQGRYRLGRFGW